MIATAIVIPLTPHSPLHPARVFRPEVGKGPFHFHSIDTRLGKEGGAVFAVGDKLAYFDY